MVCGNPYWSVFAVFDGHGRYGELVSHVVRDSVMRFFGEGSKNIDKPKDLLENAFAYAARILGNQSSFDASFSGCTGTMVLIDIKKREIYTCNVGDSRIILGTGRGKIALPCELTIDHSPDVGEELRRIQKAGGRVMDFGGVARVCGPVEVAPGLAMSRSFGDNVATSLGVNCIPDSQKKMFGGDDKFVIVGSDGIYDFLSNAQICSIVSSSMKASAKKDDFSRPNPQEAASTLVKESTKRWLKNGGGTIDDCTCFVILLNSNAPP